MWWGATLLALSRARLTYMGLVGVIYLLYPRFASWRVTAMRYSTLYIAPDLSTHIEIDIHAEVYNPNHVGAYLHNASLHLYRVGNTPVPTKHTLQTIGSPFGTAVAGSSPVPRRGHFDIVSHVSIADLPLPSALSFVYEIIMHAGVVKVRGIGTANVVAVGQDIIVWLDCLQHVNLFYFPVRLEHSDCTYRFSNRLLRDLYQVTEEYHPLILELFASFDLTTVC